MIRRPPRSTPFLHDALPISGAEYGPPEGPRPRGRLRSVSDRVATNNCATGRRRTGESQKKLAVRSEEHTSELQSHVNLVCRLLLEKKKYWPAHRLNSYLI